MLEMTLIIHGRVQGVGFRYSVIDHIESNQITVRGSIQNLPNGTVKIVAQGHIEDLKDLRRFAVNGNEKSQVRDIEEVFQDLEEYSFESFEIIY